MSLKAFFQSEAQHDQSEMINLRRLFWLRNVLIIFQVTAVAFAVFYLGMQLPLWQMSTAIAVLVFFNLVILVRSEKFYYGNSREFFIHLLVDVAVLVTLFYFSGGASNPFVSLLLVPIIVAATVLSARYVWSLTLIGILSYSLLLEFYVPLSHDHSMGHAFSLHVFGMWFGFVLSALLVAYFIVHMAKTIREKDQQITRAREAALRDQQLVSLGTLAASTAHNMGTPLGTISILTEELMHDLEEGNEIQGSMLETLKQQVVRCKEALSVLSVSADGVSLSGGAITGVKQFVDSLLDDWRARHQDIHLETSSGDLRDTDRLWVDTALVHAIQNVLDNAADASPEYVEWSARAVDQQLLIEVLDRGPGISGKAIQSIGRRPYSEKSKGLGVGLFLSYGIIERMGGRIELRENPQGGLITSIQLPLSESKSR